jgi:hypothetical protein
MLKFLVVTALLFTQQNPAVNDIGIIAGTVDTTAQQHISQPLQVVLLSSRYTELWNSDVQKQLDVYWERYKPAFAQNKEYFFEVSRKAYKDAMINVVARMRRDLRTNVADFIQEATPEGKFEFKHVPFGEYKILVTGQVEGQDVFWQDTVDVHSPVPQFLQLKKRLQ